MSHTTYYQLMSHEPARVRRAADADFQAIIDVCASSLGWSNPAWDEALFRWKHIDNAFGRSLVLVAEDETGILAVRAMLRWRFRSADGVVDAIRPVDTATRSDARGRGLFKTLTLQAVEEAKADDVAFAFNTPNTESRPGYLKMGWVDAGRVPIRVRPRNLTAAIRTVRSRQAALKPSLPQSHLGISIEDLLEQYPTVVSSGASPLPDGSVVTDHSPTTLRWRYASGPATYRALLVDDGAIIIRLRQRGVSTELVVADCLGDVSKRSRENALGTALSASQADHLVSTAASTSRLGARLGPRLTVRSIAAEAPQMDAFQWAMGDIELF